ncbi:hypothetical protein [Desulfobacterium sp. N47]|uniref:Uncharacterized protein n=1 Tax=uncultured Desulfobacterium sp. TaxID=201089 RepID=E1YLS3_9BACT|nr:hypothetical protein N47_E45680 [uncultured Desulfobacterium sp.]
MKRQSVSKDYVHTDLNEEFSAIGGYYVLTEETCHPFCDREILYLSGYCVTYNSCCGSGNLSYAIVPGFIIDWKYKKNSDGFFVSRIEPVRDQALQKKITSMIEQKESVSQVNFL